MKKIFWDANVMLDLIDAERENHRAAIQLLTLAEELQCQCLCSWDTLSLIDYLGGKKFGSEHIWKILREIVQEFIIPKTGSDEAQQAFAYLSGDFEDAMQITSALTGKADYLVTRDTKGFKNCPIPVLTPTQCVEQLRAFQKQGG